jgi:nickel-dependent lactate racemase
MINFGEIVASHQQAVEFVRQYCEIDVPRRFSTVLTSGAGYPLDKTYYQTIKGMVGAMNILKPGGDLIIASQCEEGLGSAEFAQAQRRLVEQGPDPFLKSILKKSHADIDEWQTQMQLGPMSIGNVFLYSDKLSATDGQLTGIRCVDSLEQAIRDSLARHPSPAVAVIPEGPYVIPFYRPAGNEAPIGA